jgi:hypothetical protein
MRNQKATSTDRYVSRLQNEPIIYPHDASMSLSSNNMHLCIYAHLPPCSASFQEGVWGRKPGRQHGHDSRYSPTHPKQKEQEQNTAILNTATLHVGNSAERDLPTGGQTAETNSPPSTSLPPREVRPSERGKRRSWRGRLTKPSRPTN